MKQPLTSILIGLCVIFAVAAAAERVGEVPLRADVCAFVMEREGKGLALLWLDVRSQGVKARLDLPANSEGKIIFHDVMGNRFEAKGGFDLTPSPVYGLSTTSGADLLALLKEARLR